MAISNTCVYEMRTTGSMNNGGGYVTGGGGQDYSQQDSPQESYTTLACLNTATTLTCSGADTFNANIVGNIIKITGGTNFTVGWYQVMARASSTSITIDRTAAAAGLNATVGTGNMGGAVGIPTDAFYEQLLSGQWVWVKSGTYVWTETVDTTIPGTASDPITFEGYNTSRDDEPTGDNRPYWNMGTKYLRVGYYWTFKSIRMITDTSTNQTLEVGQGSYVVNCYIENTTTSTTRRALYLVGTEAGVMDSEIVCKNATAVEVSRTGVIEFCWIHDSLKAIVLNNIGVGMNFNIIDTCTTGVILGTRQGCQFTNNVFYNCTTGITGTSSYSDIFVNNIFCYNTTGISWTTNTLTIYSDYNNWYGNGTDAVNYTKGDNETAVDPEFEGMVIGTDLACSNSTTVTAASNPFSASMVGEYLTITDTGDGGNFNVGNYLISTFNSAGSIVLSTKPVDNGTNDTGGNYMICDDFSLKSTSNCIGAGFGIRLGV